MRFIIFCAVAALAGYVFGYVVGRWTAEPYIGKCKKIERIKMMNDSCRLFEEATDEKP